MLAVCIECSLERGMGHLFRCLNLVKILKEKNIGYIVLVNDNEPALQMLRSNKIPHNIYKADSFPAEISREDIHGFIDKYGITCWYNDRLNTSYESAKAVKDFDGGRIPLFTVDDMGPGAELSDGNFASLIFDNKVRIPGKKVYTGCRYLILNKDIEKYKRKRTGLKKILITLGGSDTFGVSAEVIRFLLENGYGMSGEKGPEITVLMGPGSNIKDEVAALTEATDIRMVSNVPSMPEFMYGFDLAITGGGVTPFEANAAGLPCIVIANEEHEIQIGKYLEGCGGCTFAGHYSNMDLSLLFKITDGILISMSIKGMSAVTLDGADNVIRIISE